LGIRAQSFIGLCLNVFVREYQKQQIDRQNRPVTYAQQVRPIKVEPKTTSPAPKEIPEIASAADLVKILGRPDLARTGNTFLVRFAESNKDCRIENPNPRKNEARYLYRTKDIWDALKEWVGRQKQPE